MPCTSVSTTAMTRWYLDSLILKLYATSTTRPRKPSNLPSTYTRSPRLKSNLSLKYASVILRVGKWICTTDFTSDMTFVKTGTAAKTKPTMESAISASSLSVKKKISKPTKRIMLKSSVC